MRHLQAFGTLALLLVAALPLSAGESEAAPARERGPILIEGDAGFTPENGATRGTGAPDDPFVIEGWTIRAQGPAVRLNHTSRHVVVRNNTLAGNGSSYTSGGIHIHGSNNVRVDGNDIDNHWIGVWVSGIHHGSEPDLAIARNRIRNASAGIFVDAFAQGVRVEHNLLQDNLVGSIIVGDDTRLLLNVFDRNSVALRVEAWADRTLAWRNNLLSSRDWAAVWLASDALGGNCNYWGSREGPSRSAPAGSANRVQGAAFSNPTFYRPYRSSPDPDAGPGAEPFLPRVVWGEMTAYYACWAAGEAAGPLDADRGVGGKACSGAGHSCAGGGPGEGSGGRVVRARYESPSPGDVLAIEAPLPTGGMLRAGGVRLQVFPEEDHVTLSLYDDSRVRVAARWSALDAVGQPLSGGRFCVSTDNLTLPAGTRELWVLPSLVPHPCDPAALPRPATRGELTAQFPTSEHVTAPLPTALPWLEGSALESCMTVFLDVRTSTDDRTREICGRGHLEPTPLPSLVSVSGCGGAAGGTVAVSGAGAGACAGMAFSLPSPPTQALPAAPQPRSCPAGAGLFLASPSGQAGGCVEAGARTPSTPLPSVAQCPGGVIVTLLGGFLAYCSASGFSAQLPFSVDLTPCAPQSVDPAVYVKDGYVRVCVVYAAQPPTGLPQLPSVRYDLSPCSMRSLDPAVFVNDGGVSVCVTYTSDTSPDWGPLLTFLGGPRFPACKEGTGAGMTVAGAAAEACVS